jgi:hypothetical protein
MSKQFGPTSTPPVIRSVPVPSNREHGAPPPPIVVHPHPIPYPTVDPGTGRPRAQAALDVARPRSTLRPL